MTPYTKDQRLETLQTKGGMMFFTIVRPSCVYRGLIVLSPVSNDRYNKDVFIKEYKFNPVLKSQGGQI